MQRREFILTVAAAGSSQFDALAIGRFAALQNPTCERAGTEPIRTAATRERGTNLG